MCKNNMLQELYLFQPKLALRQLAIELMLSEYCQYNFEIIRMFLPILGADEDVIYEHHHKIVQIGGKNLIHVIHEDCWSISHPKWHYYILVMSIS